MGNLHNIVQLVRPRVFDRVTNPREQPMKKKSFKQRYEEGDPTISLLGESSGTYVTSQSVTY